MSALQPRAADRTSAKEESELAMRIVVSICVLIVLGALAVACRSRDNDTRSNDSPRSAEAEAGMCEEHGVLEAVCTKCNPALVPVFKARGDWCEEHGFPESFCPICRPDRGGRPAIDVSINDEGPADGTKVRLATPEAIQAAGIRTVSVVEAASDRTLTTTARIVYDAARVAVVNARSPGVVERVIADVGTTVRRGDPLAVIQSAGIGAEQSRTQAARSRAQVAEANHRRAESLRADGIAPERDVLAARQELDAARAELAAAQAALRMVGSPAESNGMYTLRSPLSGVVTRRNVTQGELVAAESALFEVVDPSRMWAEVDVPEQELALVRTGQRATIHVQASGDGEHAGEITYIAPEVDPRTRTANARVPLDNADGVLRAHMFAEARIAVPRSNVAVLVPLDAVQRARTVDLVFVRLSEGLFEARRVRRGAQEGSLVAVTGNLQAGDQVVTEGSFLLKTETLKESIGAGCVDDH